jgi:hypothetical protein
MAAIQIILRRDTAANWSSSNPILAEGEVGVTTDTRILKIGNGSDAWNTLQPANTGITAVAEGIVGTDRTFLENDGGTVKVSIGSVVEADGTVYEVTGTAEIPSGTPADGAYLFFDPNTGLYTWSAVAGTADPAKGGLYDGSGRRQCRWRLTSATTWKEVLGDDVVVDGDLSVGGAIVGDVTGSLFGDVTGSLSGWMGRLATSGSSALIGNVIAALSGAGLPESTILPAFGVIEFRPIDNTIYTIYSLSYTSTTLQVYWLFSNAGGSIVQNTSHGSPISKSTADACDSWNFRV